MNANETPSETPSSDGHEQGEDIKRNVKSRSTWLRLFFMVVVTLLYAVSCVVMGAVVVVQFFWVLFTAKSNVKLQELGESLATYTYQVIRYLSFNTEERPFPFDADWPRGPPAV